NYYVRNIPTEINNSLSLVLEMHFLHPEILWGLFALLIPIAIHLFNFRRYKRISFSNVAFLTEVKAETNKASRLRNLIILLIRLFLFSAIIIAFAQPFIPTSQSDALKGQRAISIYIDNSYSNQNLNQGIATLEWHKEKARSVVQSFSSFDKFQILTNDISGKDGQSLTQEEALLAIQNIQFSPSSNNLNEINERQNNYFGKVGADVHLHYWFSDFQKTMADIQLPSVDSSHLYVAIPTFPDDKNNISLDSIYFKSNQRVLNQADTLEVLVTNHGTSSQSATLQLEIDGSQKAVATNELESGQQLKIQLQFSTTSGGLHQGKVSLADEFVPFDNQLYFSYQLAEQIHVLEFTGNEKKATRALFENDSQYSFESRSIENFNSEIDQRIQFLILQGIMQFSAEQTGWIESFIDKGGHAFILPHSNADLVSYNDLLGRLGSVQMLPKSDIPIVAQNFEIKDPFYAPAFEKLQENTTMPSAEKRFPLANNNLSSVSLIHF
ncbi:MAG: BatA domain-containing protein, partial [Bacteroidota bacterium]